MLKTVRSDGHQWLLAFPRLRQRFHERQWHALGTGASTGMGGFSHLEAGRMGCLGTKGKLEAEADPSCKGMKL